MYKSFLFPVLFLVTTLSAFAQSSIVTEQPEGTLYEDVYGESERSYFIYNGMSASSFNGGYPVDIVVNGNEIYVYNIISHYPTNSWVKGSIDNEGNVEFKFPQPAMHVEATENSEAHDLYINMMSKVDGQFAVVSDNNVLKMKYVDGTLTQVMSDEYTDLIVAICGEDNIYMAFGEKNLYYELSIGQTIAVPEGLQSKTYTVNYIDKWDEESVQSVNVGIDGSDIYIQGLYTAISTAWVKGTIDTTNGNVTIPSKQLMGLYSDSYGSNYVYCMGAHYESPAYVFDEAVNMVLDGDKLVAQNAIIFNFGYRKSVNASLSFVMDNAVFSPVSEGPKTPSAPYGFDPSQYNDNDGMGLIFFMLDAVDTNGEALDKEKLFYNIYINGELLTVTPDEYFIPEAMTDIPYTFSSDFIMAMDNMFVIPFFKVIEKFGVRAVYKDGENVTYSDIVEHVFEGQGGIGSADIENAVVVSTEYYTIDGRLVSTPSNGGLYIRRTTFGDNTVSVDKVVIR